MKPIVSLIIPTFNEASSIEQTLNLIQPLRRGGAEAIVVDGGSNDDTVELATPLADQVLDAPQGRALQMNHGASKARGNLLLFLHADSHLPENALEILAETKHRALLWGRFDVRLSGNHGLLRVIEFFMNWRSRITGIATGDQALFVNSELFRCVGGFPELPLMEDIALTKMLRRLSKPLCLSEKVISSSRRWETNGILRTVLLMWQLRLRYILGTDPSNLARLYR